MSGRSPPLFCVCCVFSSHSLWTSSSLDVPAGVTQEEGQTGFFIHLLSAVRTLIFLARRIQPFLSLVDRLYTYYTVFVEVFGAFGLTISENKTETMCMPIPRAPATKIVFNATGQQYRQTTSFTYLGGTVTEMPNLSDEIDRRIRAGWMGFKRYKRELYDLPKASLLPLKARMVRSEVVEALLYGCVTWTP